MLHIVERIIDGLPVYLREDYPKFVELLRAYYTWQSQEGKFLEGVYSHEANIDVDQNGLERVMLEMDEGDVPVEHRRAFAMFSRSFNSSRGSLASFDNFFRIFHDSPVRVTNSARYVFMPSAAVRERYHRAIVSSPVPLPTSGVLRQAFGGGSADVVAANCIAVRAEWTYETIVVLRNNDFYPGVATISHGDDVYPVTFVPFYDFVSIDGNGYNVGDAVEVTTDLMTFLGEVRSLKPISVESVSVVAPGTGYAVGNLITIPGARGFRAEVSAVDGGGGVEEVRVVDIGDPFGGLPSFFIAGDTGTGAVLEYAGVSGRPLALAFDLHPFGVVTGLAITSETGADAAFLQTPRLFHETWVPRGYNGVIGVGSTLTDSAAYQDASYIVSTPVDASEWTSKVAKLLHPTGRYMHAVKTAGKTATVLSISSVLGHIAPFEYMEIVSHTGEMGELLDTNIPPPPIDLSMLFYNGQSLSSLDLTISRLFKLDMADGQTVKNIPLVTTIPLKVTYGLGQSLTSTLSS